MRFWDNNDLRDPNMGFGKTAVLGLQHTFTMFGATVLVPIILEMDISVALFMAGMGTLLFHLITRGGVPIFLGSSFAFIVPMLGATSIYGLEYALGGIVVSGLIYILLSILVFFVGTRKIISFFPPIVTGPVIMVIGIGLAPTAIDMVGDNWLLALFSFSVVVCTRVYAKGFAKVLPVLIGLCVSYLVAALLTTAGVAELVDFAPIGKADWFGWPKFVMAKFDIGAIMLVAPVVICTMVEHLGDMMAIGEICGKDFINKPGLHRTLIGDGLASCISAMFGGPANTTYSENTGVLALTRAYNPTIMRIAACFALLLSVVPKLGAVIRTIPTSVIGGISIVLFGMIASVGVRSLVDNKVDFQSPKNLIIAAVILVLGIGGASIPFSIGTINFNIEGMALAAIAGIILNKLLPEEQ